MSYLDISTSDVKLSGAGARLQWGMAVGIVVDKIVGMNKEITDEGMLSEIRAQLGSQELRGKVINPATMSAAQKHITQGLLHGAGTKLTTTDLQKVFTELH